MAPRKVKCYYVLGLDTSTTCVGYAVFKVTEKTHRLTDYGKIVVPEDLGYLQKCEHIVNKIESIINKIDTTGLKIALEEPNSFINGNTTRMLCGIYQIVRYMIYLRFAIESQGMNTKEIKKMMSGNGSAKKQEMVDAVNGMFGLKLNFHKSNKDKTDDDIADAIAVAELYIRKEPK